MVLNFRQTDDNQRYIDLHAGLKEVTVNIIYIFWMESRIVASLADDVGITIAYNQVAAMMNYYFCSRKNVNCNNIFLESIKSCDNYYLEMIPTIIYSKTNLV